MATKAMRIEVEQPAKASLPKRVSYSQMSLYQQCPLKYFFSYIAGWREPPTSALAGGSITHEICEYLYRLEPQDRTLDAAMNLLREHGPRMLRTTEYKPFENDLKMKHSVKEAIENLFKVEDPTQVVVQPEHIEMELSVEINGVNFFGKVDRFTVDGINRVTDYKTGKLPGKFIDEKFAQPYLYALGFKTQYDIVVDEVELIFLNESKTVQRPADSGLVLAQGEKLAQMRTASEFDVANSSWEARVSSLCGYCAFERVCPARTPDAPAPGSSQCNTKLAEAGLLHK